MDKFQSVNKLYEKSFRENWDRPALSNYQGVTLHYRDVARRIAKMHIMYEECGLVKGDKVAICSRNQANWGVSFISALTYGAVPVPILHEFKPGNIHHLVNHSEAKILFVDDVVWEGLTESEMPNLQAVVQISTLSLLYARTREIKEVRAHLNELFGRKYPMNFTPESIDYYEDSADELALINYTSGTSGFSKGVMIPYRALFSNIFFAKKVLPMLDNTSNVVAMLPSAHMYGMMFEVLFELSVGTHVISITADAQYSIENAVITFNGQTIENNGTITITSDMNSFTLAASGATPADTTVVIDGGNGGSDMGLTDYLLIVLVILIVIMAIIVALRLMRS